MNNPFKEKLENNKFVITAELCPPKSSSIDFIDKRLPYFKFVDAINITNNHMARIYMSALAVSIYLASKGYTPIYQITTRDLNKLALFSNVIAAYALGVENLLVISGDNVALSPIRVKAVSEYKSHEFIRILAKLKEDGISITGEKLKYPPKPFIGAAANPYVFSKKIMTLKVLSGASFFQTQPVYNVKSFFRWLDMVKSIDKEDKIKVIAGIMPLKNYEIAKYLQDNVKGIKIPSAIFDILYRSANPKEDGYKIILDIIAQLLENKFIAGIHIMAIGWYSVINRIIQSNILKRRIA